MIVNTRRLFAKLLSSLEIGTICDVGSMDGTDALFFRDVAPDANIYAFEPSPTNLRLMQANPALRERRIRLVPMAATNYDGEGEFFVVEADHAGTDGRRGMSSLHRRPDHPLIVTSAVLRVKTTRLDTFLTDPNARLALWIDVEGKAYEVLEGIAGIASRVHLLHVEVETTPCISPGQKLYPEVKALLNRQGFTEIATDQSRSQMQFNAVFARTALPAWTQLKIRAWLLYGTLRFAIVRGLLRSCPACIRHLRTIRSRITSA